MTNDKIQNPNEIHNPNDPNKTICHFGFDPESIVFLDPVSQHGMTNTFVIWN